MERIPCTRGRRHGILGDSFAMAAIPVRSCARWPFALAALFADGIERSTHRVARAFDSDPCTTRDALARGIAVEPAGVETWRALPTIEALRARVAELEARLSATAAAERGSRG